MNIQKNESNSALNPSSGRTFLPDWGLIFVEGADAASFLQNQLTNSVLGLKRMKPTEIAEGASGVRLIGYCNPKGRLLASAWVALFPATADGDDRFALFISKDIAATTAKRLAMFVLRSKVKVTDASADWFVSGLYGALPDLESTHQFDPSAIVLRIPDVLYQDQSFKRILIAEPMKPKDINVLGALEQWNLLEIQSAIPRIVLATQEQFVPQMINFESVAGVDFKKGCYPGQEIVARSQYRGVIKRRLQLANLVIDPVGSIAYGPGIELFHSEDSLQPAGMVVLSVANLNKPHCINMQVECKLEGLEHGEIHLGSIDGPVLKMNSLPYRLLEI